MAKAQKKRRTVAPVQKVNKDFKKMDVDGNIITPSALNTRRHIVGVVNGQIVVDDKGQPVPYKKLINYR
jgi:hypothetical protein